MKKRIFALCVAVLMAVMSFSVFAESEYSRLQDIAEILSETENTEILAKLDEVSEKHGMDIAILTVGAVEEGLTVEEDATEWYEYLGFAAYYTGNWDTFPNGCVSLDEEALPNSDLYFELSNHSEKTLF